MVAPRPQCDASALSALRSHFSPTNVLRRCEDWGELDAFAHVHLLLGNVSLALQARLQSLHQYHARGGKLPHIEATRPTSSDDGGNGTTTPTGPDEVAFMRHAYLLIDAHIGCLAEHVAANDDTAKNSPEAALSMVAAADMEEALLRSLEFWGEHAFSLDEMERLLRQRMFRPPAGFLPPFSSDTLRECIQAPHSRRAIHHT